MDIKSPAGKYPIQGTDYFKKYYNCYEAPVELMYCISLNEL